ncbi:MAG: ABC transporter ATP-binding protein/permease [Bacilli bacterium]|nr:ABC transporter ATP-binding protein/permease [Bacilli bacterium]
MFKLYKNLTWKQLVAIIIIFGLTFLQVYCTMTIVDFVKDIIQSIMYVNYHNNPASFSPEFGALVEGLGGWDGVVAAMSANPATDPTALEMVKSIANATTADIWYNGGMMIALAAAMMVVQAVISLIASYAASGLSTTIRTKLYKKVEGFSLSEVSLFSTPSLINRTTNDLQHVQMTNVMMLRMIFAAPITAVWAILKIRASSAPLTIATAVAIVTMVTILIILMILVLPKFKIVQNLIDRLNGVARENLTGIRIIRAFNGEKYQEEKFEEANQSLTKTQIFTGRMMALLNPFLIIIMNGVSLAIYWIGSNLINKGEIDYATVQSFSMLATQIIMAFMMLMMRFVLWPRAEICAKRINEIFDQEYAIVDPSEPKEPIEQGTIEFKDVSFRFPDGDDMAISHISFKANKGETVAIIGATGSGKTSIVNLIPRLFDATEGEVLVDGVNVKDMTQKKLRSLIGYVPQRGFLFKGSISSNVALGNPEMSEENIVDSCKVAEADTFVREKENGYEFEISQGGKNVSGGQRQRLCIARAVALRPEIYIFDDSFSALDYKTDRKVRDNLANMGDGATKVIVAQRIGTIIDADQILVIEDGKVVGHGTHEELLRNCDVYLEIALSQLSKEELGLCQAQ